MNDSQKMPILFIIGLSGAGKTTLGRSLQNKLNFLHIEQDIPAGDIIDILGIRNEWDRYLKDNTSLELGKTLRRLGLEAKKDGVVMTFDSLVRLTPENIRCARKSGIKTFIMFGTKNECLNSYLERERMTGRGYSKGRWIRYDTKTYELFSKTEYKPYRLIAFDKGKHKPIASIIEELGIRDPALKST